MQPRRSNSALAALVLLLPLLGGCSDLLRDDGSFDGQPVAIPPQPVASSAAPSAAVPATESVPQASTAVVNPSPDAKSGSASPAAAPEAGAPEPVAAAAGDAASPAADAASAAPVRPAPQLPPEAVERFERALGWMRSGDDVAAETELRRMSADFPQLAAPQTNLGILYRKAGRADDAAAAFREAVQRNPGSAAAWNELGVNLRQRGAFDEAVAAYERAIAADATFAPAHRNLGILLDVYRGDTPRALEEFELYQQLVRDDKLVASWVADLRQRVGKAAKPGAADAAPAASAEGPKP